MDMNKFPAGLRVLAIDDDRTTLLVLKRQLQLCKYDDVTTMTEAEIALGMLRERKDREDQFNLVISDVGMTSTDGFRLLELIRQEMDIPVIILSGNEKMETMMNGIKHGACDYLVKPAHMEQVRNLWMHVVRKKMTDSKNNANDGKKGANHTKKDSRKNKKEGDCAEEDNEEGTSTQKKRQRIKWSEQLHSKFVEAINLIGMDRAVPKTILEVMSVDGLSRENVASHLQKYRIYLRKNLSEGTLSHSNPFVEEPQKWLSDQIPADRNRSYARQCFPAGSSSSSSANISNGVVFSTSRPLSSGSSSANISNGSSPSAMGMHLPSSHSWSSYASIMCGKILRANRGIPFDANSIFEEIEDGGEMADPSSHLPMHPQLANQHSFLIQPSSTGLSNQVSTESQFAGLCNNTNTSWRVSVQSSYPNIGHSAGTSISASQGNNVRINQISRFAATSSHAPTFGNEYQNQMVGLWETTTMLRFSGQVAPFNFGSAAMPINSSALANSSSVGPTLANLQIENSTMQTHETGNLPKGGTSTTDQDAVGDQVTNYNELPTGTSETQDGMIDDVDNFWANWA